MKKYISIYVKGDRNSTAYYRIYQYFDKLDSVKCVYRTMMSEKVHNKYMPISSQNIVIKIFIYFHILVRIFFFMLTDLANSPKVIVVHRRIISRYMPAVFKLIFCVIIKRGTKLIWDFDDQIIESKEITKKDFLFFSEYANKIIVTHDYLKAIIPEKYHQKIIVLPTTDGDMYECMLDSSLILNREKLFSNQINLVWVATSSNLKYLFNILGSLDATALKIRQERGLRLCLKVVCDKGVDYDGKYLTIENIKWTRNRAIEEMKNAHIGIMPLIDNEFTRGKGGFKLIQYMSVGLPCIASNVGFNTSVLSDNVGFLIRENEPRKWEDAICCLSMPNEWRKYSFQAYNRWNVYFSYERNLTMWRDLITEFMYE